MTVQTAFLGRFVGLHALAAYGATMGTFNFFCSLFNFLVDGVSAKVGKSVGAAQWDTVGAQVRLALQFASGVGLGAAVLWGLAERGVFLVLGLEEDVEAHAKPFFWLMTLYMPLYVVFMATQGVLQVLPGP